MIRLLATGKSDPGLVRRNDEDAFWIDEGAGLFAVADGVGGHRAGEVASRLGIDVLAASLKAAFAGRTGAFDPSSALTDAFRSAHEAIRRKAQSELRCRGMATTLVALYAPSPDARVAHIGDSRAYLLRRGEFSRLTDDHSASNELGRISPDLDLSAIADSPLAHVLTRCLGMEASAGPDVRPIALEKQDRLLLCCDGLTDMVSEDEIARILAGVARREACCERLIEVANEAGGKDNITVVVVDAEGGR